jgi:hypothetical protein
VARSWATVGGRDANDGLYWHTHYAANIDGGIPALNGSNDMNVLQFSMRYAVAIVGATFLVAAPLLAQAQGRGSGPRYDPATEATLTGTVESLDQITGPGGRRGRRGLGGTHLTFKTSTETLEVHLGPTAFLNEKTVAIAKGDTLVITGSRVTVDGDRVFIAKEVTKGDSTWTLRDAAGLPLWRGGGRRQ